MRRGGGRIRDDLTAAGIADVDPHAFLLAGLPVGAGLRIPVQVVGLFFLEHLVVVFEGLHFKFRVAVGTLHFLDAAVELDLAAAAWAFVFKNLCHRCTSFQSGRAKTRTAGL